ncbi:MAG TPA: MarR family transcriptional regulator [Micromonosporaceae bacterium]|nr:MarR family transcriptional regulator [Micromonosporaceae bacterium]
MAHPPGRDGAPPGPAAELTVTLERLVALLRRLPSGVELSLTTVSTLNLLEREGPLRLSDIAAREGVTQPGMTQLVTRLERDGYAQRRADPDDARAVLVGITEEGRQMLARRRATRAARLRELMGTLPVADQQRIEAALPALAHLAEVRVPV